MPDYTVKFEVQIPIEAEDDRQAEERANELLELIEVGLSADREWVGDLDLVVEETTEIEDAHEEDEKEE